MKYLKNKRAWYRWKKKEILSNDEAKIPSEFPCFVYLGVGNWHYEEYVAHYIYKQEIEKMAKNLEQT